MASMRGIACGAPLASTPVHACTIDCLSTVLSYSVAVALCAPLPASGPLTTSVPRSKHYGPLMEPVCHAHVVLRVVLRATGARTQPVAAPIHCMNITKIRWWH